jgi:1,4-dihydroxy-2-naphthoate octaprenyltransferase
LAILVALILYVNEIPDRQSDGSAGKRTLVVRLSPRVVTAGYLAAALTAFAAIGVGVGVGLLAPASLLAVAAIPLVFRVYRGIGEHYASPYALMSVMATNVSVHLLVGVLLIAGYVVTIIGAALR